MVVSEFHCAILSVSNVNAGCDVEIIISGSKPSVLLYEVFIKKIQYRIYFAPMITSAPIITAPKITSALIPSTYAIVKKIPVRVSKQTGLI